LGDRIAPRSLGSSFRWLWAATVAGNLGDGLLLAVAPLLVASPTSDPFAIAGGSCTTRGSFAAADLATFRVRTLRS
jgi:hypothetical protein